MKCPTESPTIPAIRRYGIDVDRQTAVFELADGEEFSVPFPRHLSLGEFGLKRAVYDVRRNEFVATLPIGDEVTLEMTPFGVAPPQPRHPVVYLDQLHWVALARRRWTHEKLSKADYAATGELIEMAEALEITLVISSANVTEATRWTGDIADTWQR